MMHCNASVPFWGLAFRLPRLKRGGCLPTIPCPTPIEKDAPFPSAYIKRDAYTPPSIIYICTAALYSQVAAPAKSGYPESIRACRPKLAIPILGSVLL